ncbi:ABC transporter permease [Xanthomonas axonopodis]|uniref:ABC transporter permease n=1 Tax=Xanthomonas axonopodis TaxID=53413 RepID=UPI0035561E36
MSRNSQMLRPDVIVDKIEKPGVAMRHSRLSWWQRALRQDGLRRGLLLLLMAAAWEGYGRYVDNDLVLPTLSAVLQALFKSFTDGVMPGRVWNSMAMLLKGYTIGVICAMVITTLAITTKLGNDLLTTLTAMLNPLPAIALLPLALLWFGVGSGSILFVVAHSILWPLALNVHAGYQSVSETLRMAGRNAGLQPISYVARVLFPAALPSVISGLKLSWAFGWRTLIAAELVFGASSSGGGIGWFIFSKRNDLEIPDVFAGLLVIVLIGLAMEGLVFRELERRTVRRWGMLRSG